MKLSNAIVHLLTKNVHEKIAEHTLREGEFSHSPEVEKLLNQVRATYNTRSGRGYGKFIPKGHLESLLRELQSDDISFVDFTAHCMVDLTSRIQDVPLATGGYVLFVLYEERGEEYLMIVMLKSQPGMTFDEALELATLEHLDMNRLHFAARINLSQWAADAGERYISFAKGRATEVAGYFTSFVGVDEIKKGSEDTKELVRAVVDYGREIAGLDEEGLEDVKRRAYDYCQHKAGSGAPVYLKEFSAFLDEEQPERFLEYANEREVSDEIEIDRTALRVLRRYRGQDRDIAISFESAVLHTRVIPDLEEDTILIKGIPKTLKEQLSGG
jgi:nucleoid-associated protein